MTPEQSKKFIQEVFTQVFEKEGFDETVCQKYFSRNYVQYVDNKKLDYPGFIEHLRVLKSVVTDISFEFKYILAEGNKISTIHIARGTRKDTGHKVETQVNALFEVQNNQIILCNELTHLLQGDESDRDLGSRV